ncbi:MULTISPECIES: hypothetical protein [Roseomonadaceae]|uniref:Asp/Glu racemase n=1 Tax=Falsiroseomonas oleicola TaxID=2801474 RepID=A0ABS6HFQ6_9PROT|nr:hypothetical protein [Roseomonas oleicola]MBU8546533.1 hypothetical protein [Roseomonas oleicola]
MRHIACLHTAASNLPLFDAACPPGLALHHTIRPDLLAEAEAAGGLTPDIAARTAAALEALALPGIDAVLLTCSTLGPAVTLAQAGVPVRRADAALAAAAADGGGRVVALCAVETTMAPTAALFQASGAVASIRLVPEAWAAFRAGNVALYAEMVAAAADAAFAAGADCVALAQASMAPAAALCRLGQPLTVPHASLRALI